MGYRQLSKSSHFSFSLSILIANFLPLKKKIHHCFYLINMIVIFTLLKEWDWILFYYNMLYMILHCFNNWGTNRSSLDQVRERSQKIRLGTKIGWRNWASGLGLNIGSPVGVVRPESFSNKWNPKIDQDINILLQLWRRDPKP